MPAWKTRLYACASINRPASHSSTSRSPLHCTLRTMASSTARPSVVPQADLQSFQQHLNKSTRILALLGAGLSASSGLPTFRGAGGLWRTHEATDLATPEAFSADPGLVWQFYSYRRHMALKAKPNPAHYALAELARKKEGFLTLSQNVDGTYKTPTFALLCTLTWSPNRTFAPSKPPRRLVEVATRLSLRRQVLRLLLRLPREE